MGVRLHPGCCLVAAACGRLAFEPRATTECIELPPLADGYHVTVDGSPAGDGTLTAPWDLASVLTGAVTVVPGSLVWVHGGRYPAGFLVTVNGTVDAPIVIRAVPGERVTLDATGVTGRALSLGLGAADTNHVWFWGLEIANDGPIRDVMTADPSSEMMRSAGADASHYGTRGIRLINLVTHDQITGIASYQGGNDIQVYGAISSLNGYVGSGASPQLGPRGSGLDIQSRDNLARIEDSIFFANFRNGLLMWVNLGGAAVGDLEVTGNVFFSNGTPTNYVSADLWLGGETAVFNTLVADNFAWSRDRTRDVFRFGSSGVTNDDITVVRNYVVGAVRYGAPWTTIDMRENRVIGSVVGQITAQELANNDVALSTPIEPEIFVRPNRYEEGRAHVVVYNWGLAPTVDVDLSTVLQRGWAYEVVDVQDYYGAPVVSGIFDGAAVEVPMQGSPAPQQAAGIPAGIEPSESTFPDFGTFVVRRTGCSVN